MKIRLNQKWRIGGWTAILGALGSGTGSAAAGGAAGALAGANQGGNALQEQRQGGGFMSGIDKLLSDPTIAKIAQANAQGGGNAFNAMPGMPQGMSDWMMLLG